ncbi:hypothetical protein CY35_03G121000 [Sphagnum magellanicum]|nr:hypothetical protein CY35_03G121000 [Sphagnum magellanicum]
MEVQGCSENGTHSRIRRGSCHKEFSWRDLFSSGCDCIPGGFSLNLLRFLCFVCVSEEPWRRGIRRRRRRRGVWKTGKMRRCVRGDICVQGDAAGVKEAASLLNCLQV